MTRAVDRVLFGAAYYPEYTPAPRLERDLDLMVQAHVSVVRVGESVWSTWEPEDGRMDLDWLQPVLDGAAERGISAVLGTPTYAVPMWLVRRYPEIAVERRDGRRMRWGSRQEVDFTHAAFRFHAERVIRAVVARYAHHPAVIGYQVDNEPGLELIHNRGVFEAFVDSLRQRYGDVEALNEAWGLTYWSHRLSTWADLWTPHGNASPQYDLAWRRFQARATTEFIAWQAGIVRELARDDQWVTTCVSYSRPAVDEEDVFRALDVAAGNPYYAMQDALAVPAPAEPAAQGWTTSGTWALVHSADRMHASRQAPFLVTETNAGPIGGAPMNFPAWDGQWRQVAWAMVARGARMIEYWHWHSLPYGTETYWGGVLPHDQQPGRVYEQLSQLGSELERAGAAFADARPHADVGLLYSVPSKWGLSFQPHDLAGGAHTQVSIDEGAYGRLVEVFARGAFEASLGVRVLHDRQVTGEDGEPLDPARVAAELPVLVAAGAYVASDALLDWLAAYAEAGGHLVLGIRSAYGDPEARARLDAKPARLAAAAGASYQEFSNLAAPVPLRAETTSDPAGEDLPALALPEGAAATVWLDLLQASRARVLARCEHPQFGRWAAVTTARHGRGRVTTVATLPDPATTSALLDWAVAAARPASERTTPAQRRWGAAASVTVTSAAAEGGRRLHVVHNWSWQPATAVVPTAVRDLLSPAALSAGARLELGPWDVRVLQEEVPTP